MARRSVLVDDDAHGDAARRADGRTLVLSLGRGLVVHASSLALECDVPGPMDEVVNWEGRAA